MSEKIGRTMIFHAADTAMQGKKDGNRRCGSTAKTQRRFPCNDMMKRHPKFVRANFEGIHFAGTMRNMLKQTKAPEPSGKSGWKNRTCPASPYPAYSVHIPTKSEQKERRSLFTFSHFWQRSPCIGGLRMVPGLFCPDYTIPHFFSMSS